MRVNALRRTEWPRGRAGAAAVLLAALILGTSARAAEPAPRDEAVGKADIDGRELFTREWVPGDERSHGGDGLGPMFNDSSCVACHNQGGVGGGGPASKNVDIITAFRLPQSFPQQAARPHRRPRTLPEEIFREIFGVLDAPQQPEPQRQQRAIPRVGPAPTEPPTAVDQPADAPASTTPSDATRTVEPDSFEASRPLPQAARSSAQHANAHGRGRQAGNNRDREQLAKLHPGFATSNSVVLHRGGTFAGYQAFRSRMGGMNFFSAGVNEVTFFHANNLDLSEQTARQGAQPAQGRRLRQQLQNEVRNNRRIGLNQARRHGNFQITRSQRNTTALFGTGLIDAIPVETLEALAKKQAADGEVSGRVARLKDDKTGRFGWKAQIASLREFVLTACAVEVGLNVPGHPQAGVPQKTEYRPAGFDLDEAECNALIDYVGNLPAPVQRNDGQPAYVESGRKLFAEVGCAACHVPDVGEAEGIYSDLLLHDMGPRLSDAGSSYGTFVPGNSTPDGQHVPLTRAGQQSTQRASAQRPAEGEKEIIGATAREWRTPPLWGVRDSAPYLHDGRAETLEQAVALHDGEASRAADRYFALSAEDRFKVVTFLKSLVAPDRVAMAGGK